mmetsp:Transcript_2814/g.8492  ORF Transcript_2814/g.8492 Transcript_2814/m.8492 type:complete len:388 (+) Transcript_2814:199-1362(+)
MRAQRRDRPPGGSADPSTGQRPYPYYGTTSLVSVNAGGNFSRPASRNDDRRKPRSPTMQLDLPSVAPWQGLASANGSRQPQRGLPASQFLDQPAPVIALPAAARRIPPSLIPLEQLQEANQPDGLVWPVGRELTGPAQTASTCGATDARVVRRWVELMTRKIESVPETDTEHQLDDLDDVYYMAFHELARQVMHTNLERGDLLLSLFTSHAHLKEAREEALQRRLLHEQAVTYKLERELAQLERRVEELASENFEQKQRLDAVEYEDEEGEDRDATGSISARSSLNLGNASVTGGRLRRSTRLGVRLSWVTSGGTAAQTSSEARQTVRRARKCSVFDPATQRQVDDSAAQEADVALSYRTATAPIFQRFFKALEADIAVKAPRARRK